MEERAYDFIVAGGGPAGSVAAYHLAARGFKVVVVEPRTWEQLWGKPCGDAIAAHHFPAAGLPEPPSAAVRQVIRAIDIYAPGMTVKYRVRGEGYIIDRRRVGQWLLGEAEKRGAELLLGWAVVKPVIESGRVVGVEARSPSGSRVLLRGRAVIEATGVARVVKRRLPREWSVYDTLDPRDANVAYREVWEYVSREVEEPDVLRIYLDQEVAPGGYWWFFPEGARRVNLGLGVQGGMGYGNPAERFHRYLDSPSNPVTRGEKRVLEAGGAMVPTRRPSDSLAGPGVVVVGDAGYTVNPVHGGGIGYAFYSARLAAETLSEAYDRECFSEECLWSLNVKYMRTLGAKQAALDIFRRFLQRLSNEEIRFGMEKRLMPEPDVYEVSSSGDLRISVVEKAMIVLRGLRRPTLLKKLKMVADYMRAAKRLYEEYPEKPSGLPEWRSRVESLIKEFESKLEAM